MSNIHIRTYTQTSLFVCVCCATLHTELEQAALRRDSERCVSWNAGSFPVVGPPAVVSTMIGDYRKSSLAYLLRTASTWWWRTLATLSTCPRLVHRERWSSEAYSLSRTTWCTELVNANIGKSCYGPCSTVKLLPYLHLVHRKIRL